MKLDVDAVAPFASVTVTDTVDDPATVGVPEIVPVAVPKLRPLTNVPFRTYEKVARPPVVGIESENELSTVPDNPVIGVVADNSPAIVNVAVVEVLDVATPLLIVFVTTTVYEPASLAAREFKVSVAPTSPLITTPSFFQI